MVKTTLWSRAKGLCLLAALTLAAATANAKVLLNENFEYEEGNLYGQGKEIDSTKLGWIRYGSHTQNPIQVVQGALSYAGYQENAIGKAVKITDGSTTDEDLQIAFSNDPITSGSIYAAMLVNITDAGQGEQPAYFVAFTGKTSKGWADGINATEYGRIFSIKSEYDGKFKFGISKNNANPSVITEDLNLGETYLLVLKYEFIDGGTNDITSLWVNPIDFKNEPATTLIGTITQGDASTTNGLQAFEIHQGQTFNRLTPTATIDAVRVATTWAELFNPTSTGGDPDPATPTIIAPTGITFNEVFSNEQYEQKITVKGTDLEGDVTFAVDCDQVTLSATSADKNRVMSDEGFELTLKLIATDATCTAPKLTITSHNATTVEVPLSWTLIPTIDVPDLASLRTKVATVNLDEFPLFRVLGPTAVSYQDGDQTIYLQDDKGGFRLQDDYSVWTGKNFAIGTKVAAGLIGYVTQEFGYYFSPIRITTDGETDVKAVTATLAEIDADKAAYADRLVRIEHVNFANSGQKFGTSQETFSQNGIEAKLRKLASVTDIAGQDIPARATVVGISTSASAVIIAPRGWSDITPESTTGNAAAANDAAICYANDGTLYIEHAAADITIYNLTGICVAKAIAAERIVIGLPQGVYAVKIGDKTQKVVVR